MADEERRKFMLNGLSIVIDGLNEENQRLWTLIDQLTEALILQCELNRIPVTTRPYYTQHAKDALKAVEEARNG